MTKVEGKIKIVKAMIEELDSDGNIIVKHLIDPENMESNVGGKKDDSKHSNRRR